MAKFLSASQLNKGDERMPVRVYGGFGAGPDLHSVIYRVAKGQYRIAWIDSNGKLTVREYPHWIAASKWGGQFFRKPLQVKDEQTALRFLKEPLVKVVSWFIIDLAPDLPEDFEYQWVEFDEDDLPR